MNIDIEYIKTEAKKYYPVKECPKDADLLDKKTNDFANYVLLHMQQAFIKGYCKAIEDLCNK